MGQVQDKCSCLFKKEDKETYNLDPPVDPDEGYHNNYDKKSISFKDSLLRSRETNMMMNGNNLQRDDYATISEDNKSSVSKCKPANLDLNMNNKANISLIKFQKVLRGFIFRKQFYAKKEAIRDREKIANKEILRIQELEFISKHERSFKTNILLKAEREARSLYDKNGWRKFYNDESFFHFDYGKVLRAKLFKYGSNAYYTGEMNIDNEKHGFGTLITVNGVKSEGFWRNNCFTGWNRLIDSEGVIYEGLFVNGLLNGKGVRITSKSYYQGDFKNGMRDGIGSEETPDHSYMGEYKMDKKQGNGKLVYKKMKDVYEGEFQNNAITGFGFYTWANQDTFKGTFLNGKMHGRGVYKWPDGGEYTGEYINNIKEGQGRFKWANGKIFDGPFKNGKPNGIGKLIYGENIIEVEFMDGKIIKQPTPNLSVINNFQNDIQNNIDK